MPCHCIRGWTCEQHSGQPWPHDDCDGPGEQCGNPDCAYWQGDRPPALDLSQFDLVIASTRDSDEDH